ncbi:MAG: hypothetical protein AVDCRST_MAG08-2010, partial [uncultured Acetobacteraceae bacterium]
DQPGVVRFRHPADRSGGVGLGDRPPGRAPRRREGRPARKSAGFLEMPV